MRRDVATDGGTSGGGPDWRISAVRCGLEVTLIVLSVVYLYLHVGSSLLKGALLVVGVVGSVGVLMWYVNRVSLAWVRYARSLRRRERRRQERERRERRRQRRQQQEEGSESSD